MSDTIILTRYLYVADEVVYSLLQSVIEGTEFKECVFWCCELYYSGFHDKLWQFIFEFYYNFSAITHPKYERKLSKIHTEFCKNNSLNQILTAITMLFYTKKNYKIFSLWLKTPSIPNKTYVGRNPKWYNNLNIDTKYKNLVRSIHAENWHNVIFYLKYYPADETYEVIRSYFQSVYNYKLKQKNLADIPYNDKQHIVFTLIFYLLIDENEIQKKAIFRSYDHDIYEVGIKESCLPVQPVYKTLPEKLKYPIKNSIGCFPLARYNLKNITLKELYWYHWEYCCYNCPLWRERFDKYKITIDHDNKAIRFEDDDEYEEFSEQYYYENDEQSKKVQEKNIGDIPKISLQTWIESIN